MKTHDLKCWPEFFEAILNGTKNFDLRINDRGFQVGDRLLLHEYDPATTAGRPKELATFLSIGQMRAAPPLLDCVTATQFSR